MKPKRGIMDALNFCRCGCGETGITGTSKPIAQERARLFGWRYASDLGWTCPTCWANRKTIRRQGRSA